MTTATELMRLVVHEITAYGQVTYKTLEQIEYFLAAEPEADPVAWMWLALEDGEVITQYGPYLPNLFRKTGTPLYTRPEPARKPMTEEEINRELPFECSGIYFDGFRDGIDFAEKHHGIGGSDGEHK